MRERRYRAPGGCGAWGRCRHPCHLLCPPRPYVLLHGHFPGQDTEHDHLHASHTTLKTGYEPKKHVKGRLKEQLEPKLARRRQGGTVPREGAAPPPMSSPPASLSAVSLRVSRKGWVGVQPGHIALLTPSADKLAHPSVIIIKVQGLGGTVPREGAAHRGVAATHVVPACVSSCVVD